MTKSAKGCRPVQIGHSILNQLHKLRFTERQLNARIAEHKKAVSLFDYNSKVVCYVHENSHHMVFSSVKVVGHEANFQERRFLEARLSTKHLNARNDHIASSKVYKSLDRVITIVLSQLWSLNISRNV